MQIRGFMCSPGVYMFEGWVMESQKTGIPYWPCKVGGDPYIRVPKAFWPTYEAFIALTDDERKQYRVGRGCQPIVGTVEMRE